MERLQFDITLASEIMAILALTTSLKVNTKIIIIIIIIITKQDP
jgi:formyltetrahydrofolate synthetase